jgi:hypothetical protein
MASVYKRKNEDGTTCWRAVVRIKGHPPVCNHFDRKQEADDWAADVERKIRLGQYRFDRHSVTNTFSDLADRFLRDGALEHHRSAKVPFVTSTTGKLDLEPSRLFISQQSSSEKKDSCFSTIRHQKGNVPLQP